MFLVLFIRAGSQTPHLRSSEELVLEEPDISEAALEKLKLISCSVRSADMKLQYGWLQV